MKVDAISLEAVAEVFSERERYSDALTIRKAVVLLFSFLHEELVMMGATQMELCLNSACHADATRKYEEAREAMLLYVRGLDNSVAVERPSTP